MGEHSKRRLENGKITVGMTCFEPFLLLSWLGIILTYISDLDILLNVIDVALNHVMERPTVPRNQSM